MAKVHMGGRVMGHDGESSSHLAWVFRRELRNHLDWEIGGLEEGQSKRLLSTRIKTGTGKKHLNLNLNLDVILILQTGLSSSLRETPGLGFDSLYVSLTLSGFLSNSIKNAPKNTANSFQEIISPHALTPTPPPLL